MSKVVICLISLFFLCQSPLLAYSSNPKDFVDELVNDAINKLSDVNLNKEQKASFIKKVALESTDYTTANPANKKCFGKELDSCLPRFKPRPDACSIKLYKSAGCKDAGLLNPDKTESWPNAYVNSTWKDGQRNNWSTGEYRRKVDDIKRDKIKINSLIILFI